MNRKWWRSLIILALLVSAVLIIRFSSLGDLFSLPNLKAHHEQLANFIKQHYLLSVIFYLALYALVVTLTLPITPIVVTSAGFLFGFWPGFVYAMLGVTLGSVFSFLMITYFFKQMVPEKLGDRTTRLKENLQKYGSSYLLILNLTGLTPFFVINSLAAFGQVPLYTFLWTTFVGLIPLTAVFTYLGSALSTGSVFTLSSLVTLSVLKGLAALAIIAALLLLVYKVRRKKN